SGPALGNPGEEVMRLNRLIGDGAQFCLAPGEVWADAVNDDFRELSGPERRQWASLFSHLVTATTARPSKKWLKTAGELVESIGGEQVRKRLHCWLPLVTQGRSISKLGSYSGDARGAANTMNEENATCLRGLLWLIPELPESDGLVRDVTSVALSAYKK